MHRFLIAVLILVVISPAMNAQETDSTLSPWRLEYRLSAGNAFVRDIEQYPQPSVHAASMSGLFGFRLSYDLGTDWGLAFGLNWIGRQGQAWMNGTPFGIRENAIDLPLTIFTTSAYSATSDISVLYQAGIGPYLSILLDQSVHAVPGYPLPAGTWEGESAFAYTHFGALAEIRLGLRIRNNVELLIGIYAAQDITNFGAKDNVAITPLYTVGGVTVSFSKRIF